MPETAEAKQQRTTPPPAAGAPAALPSLRYLKGMTPKRFEALANAGYETLEDLAFHFPGRYLDARELVPLNDLRRHLRQPVSVRGKVISANYIPSQRRGRAAIALKDDSGGALQLVYFDYPEWRSKQFRKGDEYLAAGYVGEFRNIIQIVQPPYLEHLTNPEEFVQGHVLPLYYLSPALRKAGVTDKPFRELIHQAVDECERVGLFDEILPTTLIERHHLIPRAEAIHEVHWPQSPERVQLARRRLKYEELFFLQLRLSMERQRMRSSVTGVVKYDVDHLVAALQQPGESTLETSGLAEQVLAKLPYKLTGGQVQSLREILHDMSKAGGRTYPMNRLLQGDVGSGKTIVALLAMLVAIENGYQCAFMAPTEVLAAQHYDTLTKILKSTNIQTALLIGGQGKKERKQILDAIATGETHIAVGTHALIQKSVRFQRLGFVVTDEQHRFGVAQRKALIEKSADTAGSEAFEHDMFRIQIHSPAAVTPDVLLMTATPIPRTLALTLYGDMEVSTIRELPPGRKPIQTMLFYEHDHPLIYKAAIRRIEERGEQVFIVYPLREKSVKVDSEAAEKAFEYLKAHELKKFRVGLVHGKLSSNDKQEAMRRFREKEFDVLIATTVIEVGVDVPNATVMIIEHAERFGLAQLHQLRGRVGRGSGDSACVLVASEKLAVSESMQTSDEIEQTSLAMERLRTLVATSDGFEIAKADMQIRGTGEVMGLKQSGRVRLRLADLTLDTDIVEQTLHDADSVIAADPQLRTPLNHATREEFLRLYRDAESYLHVG
ncbi:MAG TPA: ATP-dependent DNA helicase RecG [Candidatus Kapabacteria bacterium]|nr:ATP-dependent DNA helicase RecG [Candidatus Kapabacteria bacterium]